MNSNSPFPSLPWWGSPAANIAARCAAIREDAHACARASIAAGRPSAAAMVTMAPLAPLAPSAHHIPRPGYWVVRCRLGIGPTKLVEWGPPCPAMIALVQTSVEQGQPDNLMERSSSWAAFVAGEPVPVWDLHRTTDIAPRRIYRVIREIDEATYNFLMAERDWTRRYAPKEVSAADPYKAIDLLAVDVPF